MSDWTGVPDEPDPVEIRNLVVHGWEKKDHSPTMQARIQRYLRTGMPGHLYGMTWYQEIRKGLLKIKK
jgi:hypothetical protein